MAAGSGVFVGWIQVGSDRNRCRGRTERGRVYNKLYPYSGGTVGGLLEGMHDVNK